VSRLVAWIALVALLAACERPARVGPAAPAEPPSHTRTISQATGFLEIRVTAPDAPAGPKPAVISYVEELRAPLLEAGVVVVAYQLHWDLLKGLVPPPSPDAPPPPPNPIGKWLLASPSPQVIGKGYLKIIDANARDTVGKVLDALADDPDVDPTRIGILGFSTNAFVALQATALNPRIRATVAVAGCADYHRFLHESSLAMNGEPLTLAPDYDAWLRDLELTHHPLRMVHAAVLMVNGRADLPIPISCAESTARALRRAYRRVGTPERFRFVVIDEGHALNDLARRETLEWIDRWLVRR
jgi:dienelactone hydrolase